MVTSEYVRYAKTLSWVPQRSHAFRVPIRDDGHEPAKLRISVDDQSPPVTSRTQYSTMRRTRTEAPNCKIEGLMSCPLPRPPDPGLRAEASPIEIRKTPLQRNHPEMATIEASGLFDQQTSS